MRLAVTALLSFCLLSASAEPASAKGWRGIVPLRSTRADVERLLGAAPKEALVEYDLPDENVSVIYEMLKCDAVAPVGWPDVPGWNVPKDTVVAVNVKLKNRVSLASLNVDLGNFKKEGEDSDVPQVSRYRNEAEGFGIEVFEPPDGTGERVMAYFFVPTAEEAKTYRCKK